MDAETLSGHVNVARTVACRVEECLLRISTSTSTTIDGLPFVALASALQRANEQTGSGGQKSLNVLKSDEGLLELRQLMAQVVRFGDNNTKVGDMLPRLGYDPCGGSVSLLIELPNQLKALDALANLTNATHTNADALILCAFAFGLVPIVEHLLYKGSQTNDASTTSTSADVTLTPPNVTLTHPDITVTVNNLSLANRCLQALMGETGLCLQDRQLQLARNRLRLKFAPLEATNDVFSGVSAWTYSPAYSEFGFTGLDLQNQRLSVSAQRTQLTGVAQSMVDQLIVSLRNQHYLLDSRLEFRLEEALLPFFTGGITGQQQGFRAGSNQELQNTGGGQSFYLHGTAGVGKSTFVGAFRAALETVLVNHVDPDQRVDVVKVPLNSVTPDQMSKLMKITGISDMSVERVLEQSIRRGHVVVLHLEENPADEALQLRLCAHVDLAMKRLFRRYPEFKHNLVRVTTSNYEAAPKLVAGDGTTRTPMSVVHMLPPCAEDQVRWCEAMLKDCVVGTLNNGLGLNTNHTPTTVNSNTGNIDGLGISIKHPPRTANRDSQNVNPGPDNLGDNPEDGNRLRSIGSYNLSDQVEVIVEHNGLPGVVTDLRPLRSWWLTIGFHAARTAQDALQQYKNNQGGEVVRDDVFGVNDLYLKIRVSSARSENNNGTNNNNNSKNSNNSSNNNSNNNNSNSNNNLKVEADWLLSNDEIYAHAEKELSSQDGFFHSTAVPASTQPGALPTHALLAQMRDVFSMAVCGYLRPAVIVVLPSTEHFESKCNGKQFECNGQIESECDGHIGSGCNGYTDSGNGSIYNSRSESEEEHIIKENTVAEGKINMISSPAQTVSYLEDLLIQHVVVENGLVLHSTRIHLRSEDDKVLVVGHPQSVRGGLLEFIDDYNNLNRPGNQDNVVLVVAHVNEVGQFMLRELLEDTSVSRTHRLRISKRRVVFVVVLDEGSKPQPQLLSRAVVVL